MFLCLGTVLVLLGGQWWGRNAQSFPAPFNLQARGRVALATADSVVQPRFRVEATLQRSGALQPVGDVKLVVDLSDRRVFVYHQQKQIASYPIAIGKDGWETPKGDFQVEHKRLNPEWTHPLTGEVMPPGPKNPLGSRWIGFWSDETSEIGFHGTNEEELIGMAVSHGCLRMRNQDVEALYEQVEPGTPVVVRL